MPASVNVVLFGEQGVGKSSIINLIADRHLIPTSLDQRGYIMQSTLYSFDVGGKVLNIWETVGVVDPPESHATGYLDALEKAPELIQTIANSGGVDLLLFCIPGKRITATMVGNYKLFYEGLFGKQVPIALVVTHLEHEVVLDEWWTRNEDYITNTCCLRFLSHACITALPNHPKSGDSKHKIESLLRAPLNARYAIPSDWFQRALERLDIVPHTNHLDQLKHALHDRFGPNIGRRIVDKLTPQEGHGLALGNDATLRQKLPPPSNLPASDIPINFSNPDRAHGATVMTSAFNIVLFGEAGVGKSSVINLIAGRRVTATSPDAHGCTMESRLFTFHVSSRRFNIWDTVGMGEPELSVTDYLSSIEKTHDLIQQLTCMGGVDLLLFCISGKRIMATIQGNYRLFYEVLCEKRVPIGLVVTHLEQEEVMEHWWTRNADYITNTCHLRFAGHACVTGLPDHPKRAQSKNALEILLLCYDVRGRYNMPSDWFQRVLERLYIIPRSKDVKKHKRALERILRDRCCLHATIARRMAERLAMSE